MSKLFDEKKFNSLQLLSQKQLAIAQYKLHHADAEINSLKYQLQQTQQQLQETQIIKEQYHSLIRAMEDTKFWKLRVAWFELKQKIRRGLGKQSAGVLLPVEENNIELVSIPKNRKNELIFTKPLLPSLPKKLPILGHTKTADVIVCVHNALEDVKNCLESVIRYTRMPYQLILVDDGSEEETKDYLQNFAQAQAAILIRNEKAQGYTLAANQGLKFSQSDYALLLNSDTIVTPYWLDKIIACGESDVHIGIVGPLSNSATMQSIPSVLNENQNDWHHNPLPATLNITEMAALVGHYSEKIYPRIPFLNGFCLAIKRGVIEQVGYFDEETFATGYGEENDYCLRTRACGWQLAVADDTYIYHHGSRSYNHERRRQLCEQANLALIAKHGAEIVSQGVEICRYDVVLQGIRARAQVMLERQKYIETGKKLWEGKRVFFVLPIAGVGGGGNIVLHEAEAMIKMGVDVRIINLTPYRAGFEADYPENQVPVIYVEKTEFIPELFSQCDAIVATYYASVFWLHSPEKHQQLPIRGYYIQDFEPYFFPDILERFTEAWLSYTLYPDLVRICKTEWDRKIVKEQIGVDSFVGGATVNIDTYQPRIQKSINSSNKPVKILAMIRPTSPRRAPKFTMQVLREIQHQYQEQVEILIFGCVAAELDIFELPQDFQFQNLEILTRSQVAQLMNEIDIFVDFSVFQAQGLTAMEAMCSGCAVIAPKRGGTGEFINHEVNGLIVDSDNYRECVAAVERLIEEPKLRQQLQQQAIYDICHFYPEKGAFYTLKALFNSNLAND